MSNELRPVTEARKDILQSFSLVKTETVPTADSFDRVLAEDVAAPRDYPPFSNSSMDGFALRADDLANVDSETSARLQVVADIPAGKPSDIALKAGQAARIMTGAPMPAGADSVVPVEVTDFQHRDAGTDAPDWVNVQKKVDKGGYVRQRGEDMRAGDVVMCVGQILRAQDVGLLAMFGQAEVTVFRRPRVGLLSTGDELLPLGTDAQPGKIFESNAYALAGLVQDAGAEPIRLGIASDTEASVKEHLDRAVEMGVDVIISTAGVSVGAYDYVRTVLETYGTLDIWRVNMRPGKPLAFGAYRGVPYFGLPGNPVSSFVGFEVFIRAALYKMTGRTWQPQALHAALAEDITSDGRESYLRARVSREAGHLLAMLTGHQGSGNQLSLVQANAFVLIPAGVRAMSAGEEVEVWML